MLNLGGSILITIFALRGSKAGYNLQLNPQENMWDDMREKFFHNLAFNSLDAVEDRLVDACTYYENNPSIVKSISGWNWIVSC